MVGRQHHQQALMPMAGHKGAGRTQSHRRSQMLSAKAMEAQAAGQPVDQGMHQLRWRQDLHRGTYTKAHSSHAKV